MFHLFSLKLRLHRWQPVMLLDAIGPQPGLEEDDVTSRLLDYRQDLVVGRPYCLQGEALVGPPR